MRIVNTITEHVAGARIHRLQFEQRTTDPTGGELIPGRHWFRSDLGVARYYDGSTVVSYPGGSGAAGETVTFEVEAFEAVAAGDLVHLFTDGGVARVRLADAIAGFDADGYVTAGGAAGATVTAAQVGVRASAGLTPGASYWLGTAGQVSLTQPAGDGELIQFIGKALDATELLVTISDPVVISGSAAPPTVDPHAGPTADRPAAPAAGRMYYDTTIDAPIWWDGAAWDTGHPFVVVTDFGAVGDGATDDRAAIQAAIDSLTGPGMVHFPAGTYAVSAPVLVSRDGVVLWGTIHGERLGAAATGAGSIIRARAGFTPGAGLRQGVVRFVGTNSDGRPLLGSGMVGMQVSATGVTGTVDAVYARVARGHFERCAFNDAPRHGLHIEGATTANGDGVNWACYDTNIDGCEAANNAVDGFRMSVHGGDDTISVGSVAYDNGAAGWGLRGASHQVTGCHAYGNFTGVYTSNVRQIISATKIEESTGHGIWAQSTGPSFFSELSITGCGFKGNSAASANTSDDIFLDTAQSNDGVVIVGNRFTQLGSTPRSALNFAGGAGWVNQSIVTGNRFSGDYGTARLIRGGPNDFAFRNVVTANRGIGLQQDRFELPIDQTFAVLTADVNDLAVNENAQVLRLSGDVAGRTITGIESGGGTAARGRTLIASNVGAQPLVLADEDALSGAANRFSLGGSDVTIPARGSTLVRWDVDLSRWLLVGSAGAAAVPVPAAGPTGARPTGPVTGSSFFDTDVGFPVYWDGGAWVDANGNPAGDPTPPPTIIETSGASHWVDARDIVTGTEETLPNRMGGDPAVVNGPVLVPAAGPVRAYISADTTDDFLQLPLDAVPAGVTHTTGGFTVMVVHRSPVGTTTRGIWTSGNGPYEGLTLYESNGVRLVATARDSSSGATNVNGQVILNDVIQAKCLVQDAGTIRPYTAGSAPTAPVDTTTLIDLSIATTIGPKVNSNNAVTANAGRGGDYYAVVQWPRALTNAELVEVAAFLLGDYT